VIPKLDLTVEMASWKGRVNYARVVYPWTQVEGQVQPPESLFKKGRNIFLLVVALTGLFFIALLARRNWKSGRTDRRGALRLGIAKFVLAFIVWTGVVHPVPDANMIGLFFSALGDWLLAGAFLWILYVALEPALRARWPHSIVTWNRVLAGNWLDAQVGAHILIGAAVAGMLMAAATAVEMFFGTKNQMGGAGSLFVTLGTREWIANHAAVLMNALNVGLVGFFIIFGLRVLVRRDVFAALIASLLFTMAEGNVVNSPDWQLKAAVYFVIFAVLVFVVLRLGLVAIFSTIFFVNGQGAILLGGDWKAWYAPAGLASLLLLMGIAIFAFWRSLGSRELLGSTEPEGHYRTA
jgi:serine/threonine-protein kinase